MGSALALIKSKWVDGSLVFYDSATPTQTILKLKYADGGLELGADTLGVDFKFFGTTTGKYMLWDESANKLIIVGAGADLGDACEANAYTVGGTAGIDESGSGTIASFTCTIVKGIVTAFAKVS